MSETPEQHSGGSTHLARDLTLYIVGRFALAAVIAVVLIFLFGVPLVPGVVVGLIVGFPLGLVVFRKLNRRVTAGLAVRGARRARQRDDLRAQLRGEGESDDSEQRSAEDPGSDDRGRDDT